MDGWTATTGWLRIIASILEGPTHVLLLTSAALCLFELGTYLQERWSDTSLELAPETIMRRGRARIDRVDLLARFGPMLGLMGTLIPLGPGLSALGRGDMATLASAVTVAFDTTVLGLAVGMVGFALGRGRRRLYDRMLDAAENTEQADEKME